MQEYSTPTVIEVPEDSALVDAVFTRADSSPDDVVFTRKVDGRWTPITAKEFATEVRSLAAGLIASCIQAGDRVGLMSKTRYEWTLCDYAIWTAGAVTVPIYETSSAEQVQWNLGDSGAVATILNIPETAGTATLESKTNFFRPAPAGTEVTGKCVALHKGKRTMTWQTTINSAEGKMIAVVTQTQMVL